MDNYTIITKKTVEITDQDWITYVTLFNQIFMQEFTRKEFEYKYLKNETGYAIHSFLYFKDQLVGGQSFIIENIYYKDKIIKVACSCDTFIVSEHRKKFSFLNDMYEASIAPLKSLNVEAFIGETHPMMLNYLSDMRDTRLIGYVSNYVLLVSPESWLKFNVKFIDLGYKFILRFILYIMKFWLKKMFSNYEIFRPVGYYTPSAYYTKEVQLDSLRFNYYRSKKNHIVLVHDNFTMTAELIKAVSYLLKKYNYQIKAVELRTNSKLPFPFIKYRNNCIFCGEILSDSISEKDFFDIDNWQFKRGFFD
jgi:hypothetical protein